MESVVTFDTGATRDAREHKLRFDAFLDPGVLFRFAEYMQKHQTLRDGSTREPDDWKRGMPEHVYFQSLYRHVMEAHFNWEASGGEPVGEGWEDTLCAILFNAQGLLREYLRR